MSRPRRRTNRFIECISENGEAHRYHHGSQDRRLRAAAFECAGGRPVLMFDVKGNLLSQDSPIEEMFAFAGLGRRRVYVYCPAAFNKRASANFNFYMLRPTSQTWLMHLLWCWKKALKPYIPRAVMQTVVEYALVHLVEPVLLWKEVDSTQESRLFQLFEYGSSFCLGKARLTRNDPVLYLEKLAPIEAMRSPPQYICSLFFAAGSGEYPFFSNHRLVFEMAANVYHNCAEELLLKVNQFKPGFPSLSVPFVTDGEEEGMLRVTLFEDTPEEIIAEENGMYLVKWVGKNLDRVTWERKTLFGGKAIESEFRVMRQPPLVMREADKRLALRPYQEEGVRWILGCHSGSHSCILADEMGLGKTVQAARAVAEMDGVTLVISPISQIVAWRRHFEQWTGLTALVYTGNKAVRQVISENLLVYSGGSDIPQFHVLITTAEVFAIDFRVFARFNWECVVVDEAHRLKAPGSVLAKKLAELHCNFLLLLTGLSPNLEELWLLFYILGPIEFADKHGFIDTAADAKASRMLRRLRKDIN